VYFVHSFRAEPAAHNDDWVLATSHYGSDFVAAVQRGEVHATQFHPEKSGAAGLSVIQSFLEPPSEYAVPHAKGARLLCGQVTIVQPFNAPSSSFSV
jgi:glutamine amidotransferase/cyclase